MTAQRLIDQLGLRPHPEGGYYRELYRSEAHLPYEGKQRALLTTIYFLLEKDQVSRWHCVDADEAWHFYEGAPLELYLMPPDFSKVETVQLGEAAGGLQPVCVVPAGWWQAARPAGAYALCGCTVAPGFEFSGFRFLNETEKEKVSTLHPHLDILL